MPSIRFCAALDLGEIDGFLADEQLLETERHRSLESERRKSKGDRGERSMPELFPRVPFSALLSIREANLGDGI